jgi:hypothetical protein
MEDKKDEQKEIVSLNQEMMAFDFDDISIEELEHRLELSIMTLGPSDDNCNPNSFGCGGFGCSGFGCTTF